MSELKVRRLQEYLGLHWGGADPGGHGPRPLHWGLHVCARVEGGLLAVQYGFREGVCNGRNLLGGLHICGVEGFLLPVNCCSQTMCFAYVIIRTWIISISISSCY